MAASDTSIATPRTASKRVGIFDVVRGFDLILMVLFHTLYDLVYIKGVGIPWFHGVNQIVFQRIIAFTFIFIAGCMCCLSRNNLKRAGVYALVALGIFLVTSLAGVDTAINFGIIYCMAACTFVYWCLSKLGLEPKGYPAAIVLIVLFVVLLDLPHGSVGIANLRFEVPRAPYECGLLSWAGFPGPGFSSGDYYPLLPYVLLYLTGAAIGARWKDVGYPEWACNAKVEPFTWLGQHSLLVYVLHQPIILGILSLL